MNPNCPDPNIDQVGQFDIRGFPPQWLPGALQAWQYLDAYGSQVNCNGQHQHVFQYPTYVNNNPCYATYLNVPNATIPDAQTNTQQQQSGNHSNHQSRSSIPSNQQYQSERASNRPNLIQICPDFVPPLPPIPVATVRPVQAPPLPPLPPPVDDSAAVQQSALPVKISSNDDNLKPEQQGLQKKQKLTHQPSLSLTQFTNKSERSAMAEILDQGANADRDTQEISIICELKPPVAKTIEVIISNCTRSLVTHIQYASKNWKLHKLMSEIQILASKAICANLKKNMTCFACTNGRWYRGKILNITNKFIQFENIDYGQRHEVHGIHKNKEQFREMDRSISEIPPFAERVELANVVIKKTEVANKKIKSWLSSSIKGKKYLMEIVKEVDNVKSVNLICEDGEDFASRLHDKGLLQQLNRPVLPMYGNCQPQTFPVTIDSMAVPLETNGTFLFNQHLQTKGDFNVDIEERVQWQQNASHQSQLSMGQTNKPQSQKASHTPVVYDGKKELNEGEYMEFAETYTEYMPSKKVQLGQKHPELILESTDLASVSPLYVSYRLAIPEDIIASGVLSSMQLEAIVYACQQHERILPNSHRAGFLIGDGPGVGKGRTIAGIIFENFQRRRKNSIWFSTSSEFQCDAERDLRDIGAGHIPVQALNKVTSAKISTNDQQGAVLFSSYSTLLEDSQSDKGYCGKLEQLLQWCGQDFNGVIVFDDCQRLRNDVSDHTSYSKEICLAVLKLQNKLPKARIIYASSSGVSEPHNMECMVRLGIWGEGTSFQDFGNFTTAMETFFMGTTDLAMEMKRRGMYVSRHLSFKNATWRIEKVPISTEFSQVYENSIKLWVELRQSFTEAADLVEFDQMSRQVMWSQFWLTHWRFFKYLCVSCKVAKAVELAKDAIKQGKCVVIDLGELQTKAEGEFSNFVLTGKGMLKWLVDNHCPVFEDSLCQSDALPSTRDIEPHLEITASIGEKRKATQEDSEQQKKKTKRVQNHVLLIKEQLLALVEKLGTILPENPVNQLLIKLEGSEKVADMTGSQIDVLENVYRAESDKPIDVILQEQNRFMNGEKNIAIISEAFDNGICLHADRRVKNQRRRLHISLDPSSSATRAIQQFGRTHRCNQVSAPEYVFLVSDLGVEMRCASIVVKRLETLGAHGKANKDTFALKEESQLLIDNEYGRKALETAMKTLIENQRQVVPASKFRNSGNLFKDLSLALVGVGLLHYSKTSPKELVLDKDYRISTFLNRMLGVPIDIQKQLVQYCTETLSRVIEKAKYSGDVGMLDLVRGGAKIQRLKFRAFTTRHLIWATTIELHTIEVEKCWGKSGHGTRIYNVLSGSVLPVWTKVKSVLSVNKQRTNPQVLRFNCGNMRIVGTVIPEKYTTNITRLLTEISENVLE